jgi:hypothetical protein
MSMLGVPVQSLTVQVLCADGRSFSGLIFLPPMASRHSGPMRAEEWMNDPSPFFPFVHDSQSGRAQGFLLNKREVLVLTVPANADQDDLPAEAHTHHRRVTIECEAQRLTGLVEIDMPENLTRVVDYMNRPEPFLTLRDGDRHHLIQKERITRVIDEGEG